MPLKAMPKAALIDLQEIWGCEIAELEVCELYYSILGKLQKYLIYQRGYISILYYREERLWRRLDENWSR